MSITRREMLKTTGLVLGGLSVPGVLESCLTSPSSTPSGTIKIGYVSPITGPASGFGEPDAYALGLARKALRARPNAYASGSPKPEAGPVMGLT